MIVRRLASWSEADSLRDVWNHLSQSVPFRQWEWLGTWWKHYGADRDWFVLGVWDADGRLTGIAPWCRQQVSPFGRVIQFLGSGETCSDYLTVLCTPEDTTPVVTALAQWLIDHFGHLILSLAGIRDVANWRAAQAEVVPPRKLWTLPAADLLAAEEPGLVPRVPLCRIDGLLVPSPGNAAASSAPKRPRPSTPTSWR